MNLAVQELGNFRLPALVDCLLCISDPNAKDRPHFRPQNSMHGTKQKVEKILHMINSTKRRI